ncbi:cyclophilin-like fold protein [Flavobacterium sp. LS1R49]|uniref:Cyclophilin-like fold protein n=1 Tax=Flavobacterium shii TaxID=2987687 RepID=A0A9X3C4R9_9FLAO|nr:cyclophilin-like fold protein [Flavobacterium shii]MCV9928679.1 cyclophilin-like fold protein [Flavobacterium shii]
MKQKILMLILVFSFFKVFSCCSKEQEQRVTDSINNENTTDNEMTNSKIRIKIDSKVFNATLSNNATAAAFKAMLPMTVNMTELNGNEKYFNLSNNLPVNASNLSNIQNGDLMMYGSNTLVLFYKSFATAYSYTNLGRINDTTGLTDALGTGNVEITFEFQ